MIATEKAVEWLLIKRLEKDDCNWKGWKRIIATQKARVGTAISCGSRAPQQQVWVQFPLHILGCTSLQCANCRSACTCILSCPWANWYLLYHHSYWHICKQWEHLKAVHKQHNTSHFLKLCTLHTCSAVVWILGARSTNNSVQVSEGINYFDGSNCPIHSAPSKPASALHRTAFLGRHFQWQSNESLKAVWHILNTFVRPQASVQWAPFKLASPLSVSVLLGRIQGVVYENVEAFH